MKAFGSVFKYGDNVDTDVIIPARHWRLQIQKDWRHIVWKFLIQNLLRM